MNKGKRKLVDQCKENEERGRLREIGKQSGEISAKRKEINKDNETV
jgi:hypothetical protein